MPEWAPFSCKVPKKNSSSLPSDCRDFSEVYHISHLSDAKRILEDGRIKGALIESNSRLRRSRLRVAWLSANEWGKGSPYGTIRFVFDWNSIRNGHKMYWVEAEESYVWPADRFLLSDHDPPKIEGIRKYNPYRAKGPVRCKRGSWYRRSDRVSHFLLEGDISLQLCKEINFVNHDEFKCVQHQDCCTEKAILPQQANLQIMAFVPPKVSIW